MVLTIPENKSQENSWDYYHYDCSLTYLSIVQAIVRNPHAKNANGMMRIVAIRYIHFIVVT
jgi:hypothetical protein